MTRPPVDPRSLLPSWPPRVRRRRILAGIGFGLLACFGLLFGTAEGWAWFAFFALVGIILFFSPSLI